MIGPKKISTFDLGVHLLDFSLSSWNSDTGIKQETVLPKEIQRARISGFQLMAVACIWHRPVLG